MVEVGTFQRGVGEVKRKFQVEGDIAHRPPLDLGIRKLE